MVYGSCFQLLYTLFFPLTSAQIKKSLSLHHTEHFSWCTNQEFSSSAPSSTLFLVHKSRNPILCTSLGSFLGAQIKNSISLHQPRLFSWCTNQEFSVSAPASPLFLVYKSRILFLCTILDTLLGAQIKNSLSLHHPRHSSWCTNQKFSSSAPFSALFLVYSLTILYLCTILRTFLGVHIKKSLSLHLGYFLGAQIKKSFSLHHTPKHTKNHAPVPKLS